jgi:hypothetical protein
LNTKVRRPAKLFVVNDDRRTDSRTTLCNASRRGLNLLRCQTLMPLDNGGRVADGEYCAGVGFFIRDGKRQPYGRRVVRRRITQAVFAAADE